MYGKHFESMYTGSMFGSGPVVFAVWGYVIACAQKSRVELNPRLLAAILGCPEKDVIHAIAKLSSPDALSRCKDHEGRRLIKEGAFQYFVPSHEKYRAMRDEEQRREYNKIKQREFRSKKKGVPLPGEAVHERAFNRGEPQSHLDRISDPETLKESPTPYRAGPTQ